MKAKNIRRALLVAVASASAAAQQKAVRAPLLSVPERRPAADFALHDATGKTAKLKKYKGKVVLLDFWATWCTGCKQEIPMFEDLQRKFGAERFAVLGVSLDEGGWNVLKPYLAEHPATYRMLLGDDAIAKRYGIGNMPDTFLIDRHGRVAAVYLAGLVDKENVRTNINALLSER